MECRGDAAAPSLLLPSHPFPPPAWSKSRQYVDKGHLIQCDDLNIYAVSHVVKQSFVGPYHSTCMSHHTRNGMLEVDDLREFFPASHHAAAYAVEASNNYRTNSVLWGGKLTASNVAPGHVCSGQG